MTPSQRVNIHPSTHSSAELETTTFDVIFIGSGWASRQCAGRIVKGGYTAIVVENELLGGDCPFWACVPSKALLRCPEVLETAKYLPGVKERVDQNETVDTAAIFRRRDQIVMGYDDTVGLVPLIQSTGVSIVRGFGKLAGEKSVTVTPRKGEPVTLTARLAVVLSTGSVPIMPDVPGLREAIPWTPRDATSSNEVPQHLIIMGGGAVAVEMATAYSAFGSKITLITTASQLVPRVDQEPSRLLKESLEQRGVEIHLNASTIKVQRSGSNITVNLSTGETISGTELLVAAGREAQLEQLGLDKVGLSANGQHLEVDDGLKVKGVNGTWLYAAGDINGRAPMTHSSKYHATIVANGILNNVKKPGSGTTAEWSSSQATADNYAVPQVIFTDPVVATVGLTSSAAKAKGKKVREVTTTMDAPGYMIHSGKPSPSFAQWLLDENDRLVGATFVGTDAAELLHASTVAIVGGMTLDRLMHAVPSFPTLSWVYYNLMDAAGV